MPQVTKTFTSSVRNVGVSPDGKVVTVVVEWDGGLAPAAPTAPGPVARAGISAADLSRLGADGAPRLPHQATRKSSAVLRVSGEEVTVQPGNVAASASPELARLASELATAAACLVDDLVRDGKVSP